MIIPGRQLSTGPREARFLTDLERRGIVVFSVARDASHVDGIPRHRIGRIVDGLKRKGWLLKIERGKYQLVPRAARGGWQEHPFVIATGIAPPRSYISFWSALSHHGLTEQLPRTVFVAMVGKIRPTVRFQRREYRFVGIADSKYFGFREQELVALNGAATVPVRIAEPEKAILDCLDNEAVSGGMPEIIKAVRRGAERNIFSIDRFAEHAARFGSHPVAARLGYLLDRLTDLNTAPIRSLIRRSGWAPYLSADYPKDDVSLDREWHLRVNVPDWLFEREESV